MKRCQHVVAGSRHAARGMCSRCYQSWRYYQNPKKQQEYNRLYRARNIEKVRLAWRKHYTLNGPGATLRPGTGMKSPHLNFQMYVDFVRLSDRD